MELSVVVPALNGRDHLGETLDALQRRAPGAELVVVNGPSTDGTGGVVRRHAAPDRLIEVAERNPNAARNAGVAATSGDVVAFVGQASAVESGWTEGVGDAVASGADVVTGPVHRPVGGGVTTADPECATVAGREVPLFDGGNVALTRACLVDLDGFDESLALAGARDLAHRVAATNYEVTWRSDVAVRRAAEASVADRIAGTREAAAWGVRYRCHAYLLAKNYGVRVAPAADVARQALRDGGASLRAVLRGEGRLSSWFGDGRDVVANVVRGALAGLRARAADRSRARNPHGLSSRCDRAVVTRSC